MELSTFSHKIDYAPIFEEILNLKGHLNPFIGSKVTAILVNRGFYLVVELHWEGSAPAACVLRSRLVAGNVTLLLEANHRSQTLFSNMKTG